MPQQFTTEVKQVVDTFGLPSGLKICEIVVHITHSYSSQYWCRMPEVDRFIAVANALNQLRTEKQVVLVQSKWLVNKEGLTQ